MEFENRMSWRKRFFQDLENEGILAASKISSHEDINVKTIVNRYIFQDEYGDALDQFDSGMSDDQ